MSDVFSKSIDLHGLLEEIQKIAAESAENLRGKEFNNGTKAVEELPKEDRQ